MTDYGGFVNISYSNSFYFTNASNNDMLIYPETSNQSVHIGITSNSTSMISVNSNTITLNASNLVVKGPITTNNNLTYAPVDYGVSNFSIPGAIVGIVTASASNPFSVTTTTTAEGSLYVTTNNYVSITNNVFTTPWTTGFTYEAWVNYPSFTGVSHASLPNVPLSMGVFNNTGVGMWLFGPNASSIPTFYYYNGSQVYVIGTTAMNTNTWYHVAVSCDATNIRVFLNGTLQATAAISGTPQNTLGQFTFGGPYSGGGSGVANMYVASPRLVYGSALYTANFTPSIVPLSPSPIGTTALLLRVPQNPGRVLIPKIGGTTQIQAYPPAAMTRYLTNIQNTSYGAGNYIAISSGEGGAGNRNAWAAFTLQNIASISSWWSSLGTTLGNYNTTTGAHSGSPLTSTTDTNGNAYIGEWLQIQLSVSINISSFSIVLSTNIPRSPRIFYLLGSIDEINWRCIYSQTNQTSWSQNAYNNFNISNQFEAFNYYRIVVNAIQVNNDGYCSIAQLLLYGTQESVSITPDGQVGIGVTQPKQQLEVAGNAIINGNISANNMGMFRNYVINGGMQINQRGISSSAMSQQGAVAGTPNPSGGFVVDRWIAFRSGYAPNGTMSYNTCTVNDLPFQVGIQNFVRIGRTTGDTDLRAIALTQNFDTLSSIPLAGKTLTFSFYARAGTTFSGSYLSFYIQYGVLTDQNTLINGLGAGVTSYGINVSMTSGWQRYTSTFTVPSSTTQIALTMAYKPIGTAGASDYVDITGVQLEKGTFATPFEYRPYAVELELCQRYYWQQVNTFYVSALSAGDPNPRVWMNYPVPMRIAPTITGTSSATFNPTNITTMGFSCGDFNKGAGAFGIINSIYATAEL